MVVPPEVVVDVTVPVPEPLRYTDKLGRVTVPGFVETVSVAVDVISEPVDVVPVAVIVVVPVPVTAPTAVASPFLSTVATDTSLEDQLTLLVRSCVAVPPVRLPRAMNCVVSPTKLAVAAPGIRFSEAFVTVPPTVTVIVAVATVPPDCAVMVVVPAPTAVASPPEVMVATCTLLELHCTCPARDWEAPPVRLPVAMNCVVSPRKVSVAETGVMVMYAEPEPAPELAAVTVMSELAVRPSEVALMIVLPGARAVTRPLELMDAMLEFTTDHC